MLHLLTSSKHKMHGMHAKHLANLFNIFAPLIQSQIFPFIKGSLFFIFMHPSIQHLTVSWAQFNLLKLQVGSVIKIFDLISVPMNGVVVHIMCKPNPTTPFEKPLFYRFTLPNRALRFCING